MYFFFFHHSNLFTLQTAYLSLLCYNLGLDEFQKESFLNSVTWLK